MYSLDEIGLVPAITSNVEHRGDINPYVEGLSTKNKLPIFVSPMTCIINKYNVLTFAKSKVEPILPVSFESFERRTTLPSYNIWNGWSAVTLQEFEDLFCKGTILEGEKYYILIDVANGHMSKLFDNVKKAKDLYGNNLIVMIGNIANPRTYIECCKAGIDYVRVGIGGGSGCTTSVQTGIHTSMPFILEGISYFKQSSYDCAAADTKTKVVADGGVTNISRAIKCLALGADYVMMGRMFAQCEEACGELRPPYPDMLVKERRYYGQSSEKGQLDRFGKIKSNPEGTDYWIPVTTNLDDFTTHFEAALRSAMSYCNAHTLDEFIGRVCYETMSVAEFNAFNK
jgi:IMP dehydrogenase/GMP reductase